MSLDLSSAMQRPARHFGEQPIEIDVGIPVLADDRLLRHHQDAVRRLQRLVEFRDEQQRRAAVSAGPQLGGDIAPGRDVDTLKRLVEG